MNIEGSVLSAIRFYFDVREQIQSFQARGELYVQGPRVIQSLERTSRSIVVDRVLDNALAVSVGPMTDDAGDCCGCCRK